MADENGMALGVLIGLGVGALILLALMQRRQTTAASQPQMTYHNVARDEYGRIVSVETVQGLNLGAPAQPQGQYAAQFDGWGGGGQPEPAESQPRRQVTPDHARR